MYRSSPNGVRVAIALAICIFAALPASMGGAAPSMRGTYPPVAVISSPQNNSQFEPNQTITFSSNGSYDPDQQGNLTMRNWDFGDNTSAYTAVANHAYSYEGQFRVVLAVMDNDNMTNFTSIFVNIVKNKPPVAVISAPQNLSQYYVNDTIQFGSNGSYDPEQGLLSYSWDFGDYANSSLANPGHRYTSAGNFTVRLTVLDPKGLTASASVIVRVQKRNSPPVAVIAFPKGSDTFLSNQVINFSAAGSYDPDQDALTYSWNFGDNSSASGRDVTHSYSVKGTYNITLKVQDPWGLNAMAGVMVNIQKPNTPPVARIGQPTGGSTYLVNESVAFNANGSYDVDGDILQFLWNFGDGRTATGYSVNHYYLAAGSYNISLNITDGKASAMAWTWVTIKKPNHAPVAMVPTYSSSSQDGLVYVNSTVTVRDNSSYDPDGDALLFSWDFGDGGTGTGSSAQHIYLTPGNFTVKLKVTDPLGLSANASVIIMVKRWPAAPYAVITILSAPQVIYVNDSVSLTGANSSDPWNCPLTFRWKLGNGTVGLQTALTYRFFSAGNFEFVLEVSNGEYSSSKSVKFTVMAVPVAPILVPAGQPGVVQADGYVKAEAGREVRIETTGGTSGYDINWDFGDGTTAQGAEAAHSYARPGDYSVKLTVSDKTTGRELSSTSLAVHISPKAAPAPAPNYLPFWALGITLVVVIGFAAFLGGTEIGLYMLFPFFFLLYSKIRQDQMLDNYTRGQIHGYIVANPGDHYNSIRNALKLNNGTLAYHLKRLETENIVKSRSDGVYRRFYPVEMRVPQQEDSSLSDVQRVILTRVRETPGISQKDIAGLLNVSAATVNYHMETLINRNLVRRERAGMRIRYYLVDSMPLGQPGVAK